MAYLQPLPRNTLYLLIWIVMFGVSLAVGGSIFENFRIPTFQTSFASIWVATILTLAKLIMGGRFTIGLIYCVASIIAVFTTYLGPSSPLKPIFIIAGLSFDLGCGFRPGPYRYWQILLGHFFSTITGFLFTWIIIYIQIPNAAFPLIPIFLVAAASHFLICVIISYLIYHQIGTPPPPTIVKRIRDQVGVSLREKPK